MGFSLFLCESDDCFKWIAINYRGVGSELALMFWLACSSHRQEYSGVNSNPLNAKVGFSSFRRVVVRKQDSSFQNWEVLRIPKIYSLLVEHKVRQFSNE